MTTTATTAAATAAAAAATATTASSEAAEVERLITKTGEAAVGQSRTGSLLFSSGPCELLLSSSWICFFGLFASLFLSSWSLFAWLWYLVAYLHGDLDLDAEDQSPPLPPRGADSSSSSAGRPCVRGLSSFSDALLFSVDLQSTMGYGRAEIQDECPWAVALFFLQCLVAVFVQSTAMTLLCARLSRSDGSGGKASDGRRLVRYPETLRLTRADGPAVEPRFETRRRPTGQDRSRSCEHLDDLVASRAKFSKYVRNPRAPSSHGKIRGSKTKKSRAVVVGGSSEYRLELEFFGAEELVSMSVHAFLLLERISVGSRGNRERRRKRRETRMEIVSTRSLHFHEEERSNGVGSPFRSNGRSRYAHTVDRSSPLRPYLLSMMKDKPRRTPAPLPPRRRLPLLLPPPSKFAALSLENLRSEFKVPDLKPISPFRNFLLRDLWANRSCDDASVESDTPPPPVAKRGRQAAAATAAGAATAIFRKRPERDPPETPDGEGGKRPPTTKRKGLGRLLPTHLGSSSSVGDHHSVTIGRDGGDDDDDDEEDDDDDDDDDDEDDGDGRGGNDDDGDEEEGEAFRAAVESERMELVFVVEGTEAGSGALVEAWASYGPEDVVPDF